MPQSKSSTSAPKKPVAKAKAKVKKEAKPALLRVRANAWYHNGMVPYGKNWRADEVREISPAGLVFLEADAPGRWEVLDA